MIVDTGPLLALVDSRDPGHAKVRRLFESAREPLVVSPFALAEADYLIGREVGYEAARAFLDDVADRTFIVECLDASDVGRCLQVMDRYAALEIGLADASAVVLADRYSTKRIATFDHRHFRAMSSLDGGPFVILPDDEGDEG